MNRYWVVFRQEALEDLEELYDFIADAGSPENAASFTESIVSFCESFADFAQRGTDRDDLRPGLRTVGYRKRVVIAFAIINDDSSDHRHLLRRPRPRTTAEYRRAITLAVRMRNVQRHGSRSGIAERRRARRDGDGSSGFQSP